MPAVYSIQLHGLPRAFEECCGYSPDEVNAALCAMMHIWRANDNVYDITTEFIRSEMELDSVYAEMFIVKVAGPLEMIGREVRDFALSGRLSRWMVRDNCILLELDDVD
jgi:hypothetical protein